MNDPEIKQTTPPPPRPSLNDLEVRGPQTTACAMIRSLVPGLDKRQFILVICPFGYAHYFQLEDGESIPLAIGCWTQRCSGKIYGQTCRTQYGRFLSKEAADKLVFIRDSFKQQREGIRALNSCVEDLERAVEAYFGKGPYTPLPRPAAAWISSKLNTLRNKLELLDGSYIPENPEVLVKIDDFNLPALHLPPSSPPLPSSPTPNAPKNTNFSSKGAASPCSRNLPKRKADVEEGSSGGKKQKLDPEPTVPPPPPGTADNPWVVSSSDLEPEI
ncbi:hypothetical protein B0H19DRAFT_1271693 [Mycena capillaripes]|nr:hypothetical protein B0H19DRAFT_1271693 [Mycena capillaripes]